MENSTDTPSTLVIIATLDEEEGIGPSISEMKSVLHNTKFLVVDGNSKDRTAQIAKELGADVFLQAGSGKGDAIAQAIKSIPIEVEYVIFTDADFTYPSKYVPEMIQILEDHPEVGMVTGDRFTDSLSLSAMRSLFFIGNRFLARTQHFVNGIKLNDPLTGLRVIRWEILKNWQPKSKCFDIEVEINYRVEKAGYTIIEIPIEYRSRIGEKKLKLKHGLTILRRIITESLS